MFLLIGCSLVSFQYLLCFVHVEGQPSKQERAQKYKTKRLASQRSGLPEKYDGGRGGGGGSESLRISLIFGSCVCL